MKPTPKPTHPYQLGANYFIRTLTYHYTGRLVDITPLELILENVAWIADSGRFTQALLNCDFSEVEMYPINAKVILGRGCIVDAVQINTLPTAQKW